MTVAEPTPLPCGSWPSPITPETLVAGAVGISELVPEADGSLWWAESRPDEGGRTALMRREPGGVVTELTPPEANLRTRVHEYGGGAWWAADGVAWYVDDADQRLRRMRAGETPALLSPAPATAKALRYADFRPTLDGRWLIAVCERHDGAGTIDDVTDPDARVATEGGGADGSAAREGVGAGARAEPENLLVAVATDGSERLVALARGADFYGSPRLSPDGGRLAWIEWRHPNMPWDDTELHVARLVVDADGIRLDPPRHVAGGPGEAIVQPEWSPGGALHYLSDRSDRWQLYREGEDAPVLEVDGEIGYPPWVFGLSRYAFRADGDVVAARFAGGVEHLDGFPGYTAFHSIRSAGGHLAFVAASWSSEPAVVLDGETVRAPRDLALDPAFLVPPEIIAFVSGAAVAAGEASATAAGTQATSAIPSKTATTPSAEAGAPVADVDGAADDAAEIARAYALYFAPANPEHRVPDGEKPPLVVLAHGGPTSAARSQLSLARRFWTSRGFAVVDVNYRGSSGFGRRYRKALDGAWGVADVEDCVAAARHLVARGDVDPARLIIRGGSAGGFTVLSALAFHDLFTAGASLYGVADLEALAADTHKFESRYLDSLVGPYPEAKAAYEARSPIRHLDGFDAPMIVLQGSEDRIVPPNQSRMIVDALDARGVPVAYLEFEGEQHGFRRAETIVRATAAELAFYGRVFGFRPAGPETKLEIRNLAQRDEP